MSSKEEQREVGTTKNKNKLSCNFWLKMTHTKTNALQDEDKWK